VQALTKNNARLRAEGHPAHVAFAGRDGLQLRLANVSEATGSGEVVLLTTALLEDGSLAYTIGVAPAREFATYQDAFQRVNRSVVFGR
jgi:hypothetical protein